MTDRRTVEVLREDGWTPTADGLASVRKGDRFRMFEPDGEPVDGGASWVASSAPFPVRDGVWGIESEDVTPAAPVP